MNMIFKTISGVLLILFFANGVLFAGNELTVPVDGEQLYNVLFTAQKQNQDGESMLIQALSKIHVKDVLKVTPVNFKGERGANVQPDMVIKGEEVILSLGALLEFDLDKYNKNVVAPLQEVLKKVSSSGGKRIVLSDFRNFDEKWKYGNCPYITKEWNGSPDFVWKTNDAIKRAWKNDYFKSKFIILHILSSSTYEAYKVNNTERLDKIFKAKEHEAKNFSVHFVFKDEMGQEVFHEIYTKMQKEKMFPIFPIFINDKKMMFAIFDIESNEGFPLFWEVRDIESFGPLLITPEFIRRTLNHTTNNRMALCVFKADASKVEKIKSYEIYIEEAAQEEGSVQE